MTSYPEKKYVFKVYFKSSRELQQKSLCKITKTGSLEAKFKEMPVESTLWKRIVI